MRVQLLRSVCAVAAVSFALAGCVDEEIQPDPQPNPEVTIPEETLRDTTVGLAYSHTFRAEGGTPPFTFSAAGLPAGLALDGATGAVSGAAAAAGDSTVVLTVTDSKSKTASRSFPLKVYEAITIATTTLPDGAVGTAWNQKINASGGKAPLTLSVASGALPAGIEVQGAELGLTGTPGAEGQFSVSLQIKDANGATAKQDYAFTIAGRLLLTTSALPVGEVNLAYTAELAVTGGKAPLVFAATGLPAGLTLDSATGRVTGVPTTAGTANVKLSVTDALQAKAEITLDLVVLDPVTVQTAALSDAYLGQTYAQALAAGGGQAPYTWSLATGATLPQGLALDAGGTLTGTPTTAGSANVSLVVTDNLGARATKLLPISVLQLPEISSATLPDGYVGTVYTQSLTATGGKAPYTWTVTSGAAPAGLALSSSGDLSGNPSAAGSSTLGVTVTDANGRTASRTLAISIYAPPAITTTALADGYVGEGYSVTIAATGGRQPYTFSSSGTLPAGLTLSSAGILGGTPTAAANANLTLTVTDANGRTASQGLVLVVREKPAITTASLPDAYLDGEYNQTIDTTGGKAPLTWAITNGNLPAGITFNGGVLSGTPTTAGSRTFTVSVTDANDVSASKAFTLVVRDGLGISTTTVPDGYVGQPYPATSLDAVGGKSPYTFAVTSGTLPAGLTLSQSGELSGTPTAAASRTVTITVTDANGATATRQLVVEALALPQIGNVSLPDAYVARQYTATLTGTNGRQPYTWSVTGAPAGINVSASGELSGTPNTTADATLEVTLTDKNGVTATRSLGLAVLAAPQISTAAPADGYTGRSYSHTFTATGGKPGFTWSVSAGTLPAGLTLGSGGVLSGTPTATGSSTFTVKAADANGVEALEQFTLTVHSAPSITTASLADGWVNVPYSATNTATGGKGALTWSATGLPAGLSINAGTGAITGTPTAATSGAGATVELTVTDAGNVTGTKSLTLKVNPAPSITTASLADGYSGSAYSATLAATGGRTPYTWSVQSGNLPAGLSLDEAGAFSGTPTETGAFSFVVQLTDANSLTTTRSLALQIYAPPSISTTALAEGHRGSAYSATLQAAGGRSPYTWSIVSGTLQAGLSLVGSAITGTPTAAGTANLTFEVRDANSKAATGILALVIHEPVTLGTATLAEGYVGSAYSQTLTATGGKAPLTFHVAQGSALPAGLTLDSATGAISGTPAAAGTTSVAFIARDALGKEASATRSLVIHEALVITTSSLDTALEAIRYGATVAGTGGKAPRTWSATGLPSGLSINAATGVISGTPAVGSAAAAQVTFTLRDANGQSVDRALTLKVEEPKPIRDGGTAHPGVTDTMTVFVEDFTGPLADVGVRVRRNGQEYNPPKELRTGADGKVVFTGLGGNGTTDTFDVTVNGAGLANNSYLGFNAQLFTVAPRRVALPGSRFGAAMAWDPVGKQGILFGGGRGGDHDDDEDEIIRFVPTDAEGNDFPTLYNNLAALDPTGWTWSETVAGGLRNAPSPRYLANSVFTYGRVVLFGGVDDRGTIAEGDVWTFAPASRTWTRHPAPATAPAVRYGGAFHELENGKVLLFGGATELNMLSDELWIYEVETNTWTRQLAGPGPSPRAYFGSAYASGRNRLVVVGGIAANGLGGADVTDEVWELNLDTNTWQQLSSPLTQKVYAPQVAANNRGEIFVFGGRDFTGQEMHSLHVHDTATRSWRSVPVDQNGPRSRSFGTFVSQTLTNTLVLYGGTGEGGRRTFDDVWTLDTEDPDNLVWTRRSTLPGGATPTEQTISGTLTGTRPYDPMDFTTWTTVLVSATTKSGDSRTAVVNSMGGPLQYSINVPTGQEVSIVAIEFDFPTTGGLRRVNFVDGGTIGPVNGPTTHDLAFPAPFAPATLTGTFTLPQGWLAADGFGVSVNGARAGFGSHWTGDATVDPDLRVISGELYLMPTNRLELAAVSASRCEQVFSVSTFTNPSVTIALPSGINGIAPGLSECAAGTIPVVPEGPKSFTAPSWADVAQLSVAPVGGPNDWYVLKVLTGAQNDVTLPATSSLAPARSTPPNQRVKWGVQTMQLPSGVNLNAAEFRHVELVAGAIAGARVYDRQP